MRSKKPESDSEVVIVKERGINSKGYGHVAKRVLTDPDISISAKGIYGYLSSAAGSGDSAFTRRSKILRDLNIQKDAYYANMSQLEERGYIIRTQSNTQSGRYGPAIIEFVMIPSHLRDEIEARAESDLSVYSGTIYSLGWGSVPRLVMQDAELSVKAKGLYAYFCAYAGSEGELFPSREKILAELSISVNSYSGYRNELVKKKYVTIQQDYKNGRLAKNQIRINQYPDSVSIPSSRIRRIEILPDPQTKSAELKVLTPTEGSDQITAEQCLKNPDTVEQCLKNPDTAEQCLKNPDTVEQCLKNPDTVEQCLKNPDTAVSQKSGHGYIYSFTNTSNITNTRERLIIKNNTKIDRLSTRARARERISYSLLMKCIWPDETAAHLAVDTLVDEMVRVLEDPKPRIKIGSEIYLTSAICEELTQATSNHVFHVVERYLAYSDTVENPAAYLLSSLIAEIRCPTKEEIDDYPGEEVLSES